MSMRLAAVVAGLALTACSTRYDAEAVDAGPIADPGDAGSSGTPDASEGRDGAADGCAKTRCGAACVDLLVSESHCGACDRACGGGACAGGVCQAHPIATGVERPYALTVHSGAVFWLRPAMLESCAATGCAGAPRPLVAGGEITPWVAPGFEPSANQVATDGTDVYWVNKAAAGPGADLMRCPTTGCVATAAQAWVQNNEDIRQIAIAAPYLYYNQRYGPVSRKLLSDPPGNSSGVGGTGDAIVGLAIDGAAHYVSMQLDPGAGGGVFRCELTGCVGAGTALFTTGRMIAVRGSVLYASSGAAIVSCPTSGCAGAPKELAIGQAGVTDIAADDAWVYWSVRGSGTAADGAIRACRLPDCAGGAQTLAANQASPMSLEVNDGFVYWASSGLTGQASSGSIMRVRSPLP